jgi:hypothetical protein
MATLVRTARTLPDEDRFSILMASIRNVPLHDSKCGDYRALEGMLQRKTFESSMELIQEIRLCKQSYMSENPKDKYLLFCTHCKTKGHDHKQCWQLHLELKGNKGGNKQGSNKQGGGNQQGCGNQQGSGKHAQRTPFTGTCHHCNKPGHKCYVCPDLKGQRTADHCNDKGEQGCNVGKPESLNIMQHKMCFQLDGAVTADQVEAKGTYRLCVTWAECGRQVCATCRR